MCSEYRESSRLIIELQCKERLGNTQRFKALFLQVLETFRRMSASAIVEC